MPLVAAFSAPAALAPGHAPAGAPNLVIEPLGVVTVRAACSVFVAPSMRTLTFCPAQGNAGSDGKRQRSAAEREDSNEIS